MKTDLSEFLIFDSVVKEFQKSEYLEENGKSKALLYQNSIKSFFFLNECVIFVQIFYPVTYIIVTYIINYAEVLKYCKKRLLRWLLTKLELIVSKNDVKLLCLISGKNDNLITLCWKNKIFLKNVKAKTITSKMQGNEGHHNLQEVNCIFSIFLSKSYDPDPVSRRIATKIGILVYPFQSGGGVCNYSRSSNLKWGVWNSRKNFHVFHFHIWLYIGVWSGQDYLSSWTWCP